MMDELDRRIFEALQLDGRVSNATLARQLGVSEGAIRRRLERLIREDVFKITVVHNLEKSGHATTALIGIQSNPGQANTVAETLASLDEVHYVAVTTGPYDVFIWVAVESMERLGQLLQTRIRAINGVLRAQSFVNLSIKKGTHGLVV